jgi:beta-glucosidase
MPTLDFEIVNSKGERGFDATWHSHDKDDILIPEPVDSVAVTETFTFVIDSIPESISEKWTMKLNGFIKPRDEDTTFEFGLQVSGKAKLFIDGELVIDNWSHQRRGKSFFGTGTEEERGTYLLKKGVSHKVSVEFRNIKGPADGDMEEGTILMGPGVRVGGAPVINEDAEIEKAVEAAKQSEVTIVIVGLDADWECEGFDRTTLKLPGRTDELVSRVSQANPRTVVITQAVRFNRTGLEYCLIPH